MTGGIHTSRRAAPPFFAERGRCRPKADGWGVESRARVYKLAATLVQSGRRRGGCRPPIRPPATCPSKVGRDAEMTRRRHTRTEFKLVSSKRTQVARASERN